MDLSIGLKILKDRSHMFLLKKNINQLVVFTDQALVSGVNFLIGILLTRYLGIAQYGHYVMGWILVMGFSSLQRALIISPLYALYPSQNDKRSYLDNLGGIQVLLSGLCLIIGVVIMIILLIFNGMDFSPALCIYLPLLISLYTLYDYLRRVYFVLGRGKECFFVDLLVYGLQPIALFLLRSFDLLTVNSIYLVWIVLLTLGICIVIFRRGIVMKFSGLRDLFRMHWSYSGPLFWTAILQWCSGNFFIIIAGGVLGTTSVGIIRIAQNIVGVLHVLFLGLENIIPIKASKVLLESKLEGLYYFFKKVIIQFGLICLFVLGGIVVFRQELIHFLYGVEYVQYKDILLQFSVLYLLIFFGTILRFVIRTLSVNKIIFQAYILTSLVSLLSAKLLVENWGIQGAIFGLFITQLIMLFYYSFNLFRYANRTYNYR